MGERPVSDVVGDLISGGGGCVHRVSVVSDLSISTPPPGSSKDKFDFEIQRNMGKKERKKPLIAQRLFEGISHLRTDKSGA